MLRAEPLYRIRVFTLASEAQDVALALARFGAFNPAPADVPGLDTAAAVRYRDAWLEADARLTKLVGACAATRAWPLPEQAAAPLLADLETLNDWLKDAWSACAARHDHQREIDAARQRLATLADTLAKLERLNVDLAQLLRADSLLAVDIGSAPAEGFARLVDAMSITDYLVTRFDESGDQVYAVLIGARDRRSGITGLLAQAGWREMAVPAELRRDPAIARRWLETERERLAADAAAAEAALATLCEQFADRLRDACVSLALARPLADAAATGVAGRGVLGVLSGWVPQRELPALRAQLAARFHGRAWLDVREPRLRELAEVPSLTRYPRWLAPFVPLVKSYGVPRYGEFDPALPFALAWLLLFGAMFGDVGHGGVIVVLALALRTRIGPIAWVGVAAGGVSMVFGVLYGSVFGYEDLIEPVWLSPLHDPLRMLALAVAFGVGFIATTLLANAYNRARAGRAAEALFAPGGLAGLAFYLGAAGAVASLVGAHSAAVPFAALAAAGLAAIAVFQWHETRTGWGERLLVTVIETLETAISLFSNTLSFMRVAAFSLNHVALALAVFTLAAGLGAAAHGLTLMLGNVVIIVLEGGIVAIQALRLMYYEGFSRFFSADGRAFVPLRLEALPRAG